MNSTEASSNVQTSMSIPNVKPISIVSVPTKPQYCSKRLVSCTESKKNLLNVDNLLNAQLGIIEI